MALKKKQVIGYKYYMTLQMGVGRGEVDSLLEVKVGDRTAWEGVIKEPGEFGINQPDLFGGEKAEGGVDGTAELLMGRPDQKISDKIKGWLGGIVPAFRGCTTMFFDGLVCAMSAYPKAWKLKVHRTLKGWDGDVWYPDKCRIEMVVPLKDGGATAIMGMNPAHILYQVCTDSVWGRGIPRRLMDDEAWRYAADMLYKEGFGLCIAWRRSDNLDVFAQQIIDHIGATIYVDKRTGLMRLKLIRDDYDREKLPLFDVDSGLISIDEASNSTGSDAVNEVIVTYHDPITNQDASVREQNLALMQTEGGYNSKTTEYLAIPTPDLAKRVAKRDLRMSTLPLKTFSLTFDRRAWHIQPGDVIKIKDTTRDQEEIVIRVGQVEDGTLTDGKVKISAVEDVFLMPAKGTTGTQGTLWVPPDKKPKPTKAFAYEVPYANLNREFEQAEFAMIGFSTGYYGMAAERNVAMSPGYDLLQQPQGGSWEHNDGGGAYNPVGTLSNSIDYMTSRIVLTGVSLSDEIEVPCAIYVGEEIMAVTDAVGVGSSIVTLTVERGIYDTIPARHDKGIDVWFYEVDIGADWVDRIATDIIYGRCAPYTLSAPPIDPETLQTYPVVMDWRFSRPYPPGHVYINGRDRWYTRGELTKVEPVFELTWTHRDRVSQGDRMISHDHEDIGPETGSRYTIKIFDQDGKNIRTETNISGTSWKYLWAQAIKDMNIDVKNSGDEYPIRIYLWTTRDDLGSWQYYTIDAVVKDVQFYLQAAQSASQTATQQSVDNADGVGAANLGRMAATVTDYGDANGVAASNYAMAVNQLATVDEVIDYQLMEAPYITQLNDGFSNIGSRVMTFAARPTDRITDAHELWSNKLKTEVKYANDGSSYMTTVADGEWKGGGSFGWTPWAVLSNKTSYLDTMLEYSKTSADDGVDTDLRVGDIILVDKELMRIDAIENGKITVGRGVGDTIPSRHYENQVIWLMYRHHGVDSLTYGDEQLVGVKIRPITYSPVQKPLDSIRTTAVQMAYRYKRPYAPGLMIIDGKHWYESVSAIDGDSTKNIMLSWHHRNRITQGVNVIDHWHGDITPEPNTKYQITVGYTIPAKAAGEQNQRKVLHEEYVDGTEWTYKKEWAVADGLKAGNDLKQAGKTMVWVTLFAIRDGVRSWHGYTMYIELPSYAPANGEKPYDPVKPGGSGGGDVDNGQSGAGNNSSNKQPSPSVDPNEGKDDDPTFNPDKPNTADPDDPIPTPEPEHKDDGNTNNQDEVKGSWSYNYDHVWARNLPSRV